MFSKKFILFNLFHMAVCVTATIVTILILGGRHFPDYSFFEKALRVLIALFYFIGTAHFFVFFVLNYFAKYIDIKVLGRISIFVSPVWFFLIAYLYQSCSSF